jgi:tetratricopeptide (TPR) repeat protein
MAAAIGLVWIQRTRPLAGEQAAAGDAWSAVQAQFVGTGICAQCHQEQHKVWQGSHHQLAMQTAQRATVLAPFRGERFSQAGVATTFYQRDGKFLVHTEDFDGQMQEFEVTHAIGVTPLQQYLIPMPNGGMQALTIAWDTRTRETGGQRWFQLQTGQGIRPGDALHWTGRQYNWNFMCADCHTTQFKKNFDPETRKYKSSWSELSVGCEACHGPGSRHVTWAGQSDGDRMMDKSQGLLTGLGERKHVSWTLDESTGKALRSKPVTSERQELEVCARCHAHRSQIGDDYSHGQPLMNTHVPSLLEPALFWSDGQMKAEVYNVASFSQSKMYQMGVTCSDCHNPHSLQLRAPGNQTCLQCHSAGNYDVQAHHFHKPGGTGAACAACHMPTTTYMSIDPRHDHSLRIPRPDLSVQTGVPNACTKCHETRSPEWAARWARQWYPLLTKRKTPLANALQASDKGDLNAWKLLSGVMADPAQSGLARASALARMPLELDSSQMKQAIAMLGDTAPIVRRAAVDSLSGTPQALRAQLLRPLLDDPVKGVRTAAARLLADISTSQWDSRSQSRMAKVLEEYIALQSFNADRPESYNNLGTLYMDQRDWPKAEAALKKAIAIDATLAVSSLNLADLYRELQREDEAQTLLLGVLRQDPKHAAAHHALGLFRLRQGKIRDALSSLAQAVRLAPENPRFAYVYALALESNGQAPQAVAVLKKSLAHHPNELDSVRALVSFCRRLGDMACVRLHEKQVARFNLIDSPATP